MERMGITPNEFGLKVRQSPTGIAITAANKMRAAKPVLMAVDLSTKHLQAFELFNDGSINAEHFAAVTSSWRSLEQAGLSMRCQMMELWSGRALALLWFRSCFESSSFRNCILLWDTKAEVSHRTTLLIVPAANWHYGTLRSRSGELVSRE